MDSQRSDLVGQQVAQDFWIIDLLLDLIAFVDEIEVHPVGPAGLQAKFVLRHHLFEQLRRGLRAFMRNRIVVVTIANNGGREGVQKLLTRSHGLANGLRAAGIVISRMNAKLIDS